MSFLKIQEHPFNISNIIRLSKEPGYTPYDFTNHAKSCKNGFISYILEEENDSTTYYCPYCGFIEILNAKT